MDFSEALGTVVADAIQARPADDVLADMMVALSLQLGNVVALASGGEPKLMGEFLTCCDGLINESSADAVRFLGQLMAEGACDD